MKRHFPRSLVFSIAIILMAPTLGSAQEDGSELAGDLVVSRLAVARGVQGREPVDEGTSFPQDAGHLVCFTKIEGAVGETSIFHVWSYQGEEMARIELTVRGSSWRTWSKKNILSGHLGEWVVSIEGVEGEVLASTTFTIE
jgi:hypothetical protein